LTTGSLGPVSAAIDPRTTVGPVALTVRDLGRVREFYERTVGLTTLADDGATATLAAGGRPLVELVADASAPPRPPRTTGLFHLAILVPDRAELARALRRLIDARGQLQGASDHLVSEALYLADPEGNGIEIYRDRPRDEWRREHGELAMATLPLDLDDVLAEMDPGAWDGAPIAAGTRIGHVHLNVADLDASERFYAGLLGLDVMVRGYPGALFLAAGGYHHHLGLNTWRGPGAPQPPPGALGLRTFELTLPDATALEAAIGSLRDGGVEVATVGAAAVVADPSGNRLRLAAAA
jgi:catechol 2,3-dioxygenase